MGEISPIEFILVPVMLGVCLLPVVFFLLTLRNLLRVCAPPNRAMEPDQVWLVMIPFFGAYWQYQIVLRIAKSLDNEYAALGNPGFSTNGREIGLATCILFTNGAIPIISMLVALPGLICWVVYWIKMANAKETIVGHRMRTLAA